jgi:hypothetical protein
MNDTDVRSNILVLGETSPILAGVKFFSNNEPVAVTDITVTFTSDITSISSLAIYNSDSQLLGTASRNSSGNSFTAHIPSQRFYLPYRADRTLYIRALTKNKDQGGVSGETVDVASVRVEGTGVWSNDDYGTSSSDDFPTNETAFGVIDSVTSTGDATGVATNGTDRLLGQFHFTAHAPESTKNVQLNTLTFEIEKAGNVTLSNVNIRTDGSNDRSNCTVSSSTVTCTSIPANIGIVDPDRIIRVYGDVTVSGGSNNSLRLVINNPGTPSDAGDVTWTDGDTTFTWLPLNQPVVRGTLFQ